MAQETGTGCGITLIFAGVIIWAIIWVIKLMIAALSFVGATPVIILDYISQSLIWIGITNPIAAWSVLGTIFGSAIGLTQGLKRSGRLSDVPKVYIGGLALILVLVAGSYFQHLFQFDTSSFTKTVLQENFTAPTDWNLARGATVKDGGLFQLEPDTNSVGWSNWNGHTFTDVDFSADVAKVDGSNHTSFGLLARVNGSDNQNFYYLLIKGNGDFVMGKHSKGNWEPILDWQPSDSLKTGNSKNRLRIACKGVLIIGFINNQRVGFFSDTAYPSGKIAVQSGRDSDNAVAVYFDNVVAKER